MLVVVIATDNGVFKWKNEKNGNDMMNIDIVKCGYFESRYIEISGKSMAKIEQEVLNSVLVFKCSSFI